MIANTLRVQVKRLIGRETVSMSSSSVLDSITRNDPGELLPDLPLCCLQALTVVGVIRLSSGTQPELRAHAGESASTTRPGRRLLKRVVFAVAYAFALWIAVATGLEVTDGEVTSQTIPSPTSQVVYIEGECLAY